MLILDKMKLSIVEEDIIRHICEEGPKEGEEVVKTMNHKHLLQEIRDAISSLISRNALLFNKSWKLYPNHMFFSDVRA
jgi:predicted transcriptional regulator